MKEAFVSVLCDDSAEPGRPPNHYKTDDAVSVSFQRRRGSSCGERFTVEDWGDGSIGSTARSVLYSSSRRPLLLK